MLRMIFGHLILLIQSGIGWMVQTQALPLSQLPFFLNPILQPEGLYFLLLLLYF